MDDAGHHDDLPDLGPVVEALGVGVVSSDRHGRVCHVSAAAERLLRTPRGQLLGLDRAQLPAPVGPELQEELDRAVGTGEQVRLEHFAPAHDAWYEVLAVPTASGLHVVLDDITARKRGAGGGTTPAQGVALLTQVTQALGSTLDVAEGARRLARLVVPLLGDWCVASLTSTDRGGLRDLAVAHRDPARQEAVEQYARARVSALAPGSPVRRAVATGRPVLLGDGDTASTRRIVDAALTDPAARDMLTDLAPGAVLALPLTARGRTSGVLTLYVDAGRRPVWDAAQQELAVEIAARAGMALDNARLYAERRQSSLVLQESMLTALPEPDHLELRARYLPAVDGERVGGDWYDAVTLPSGATAVVIGDVTGHDVRAAALMGQLRTTLRTLAWAFGEPPAAVVARLDRALAELAVGAVATVIYATVEQEPSERARGLRRLHWTNAGHPPPVLLHADGVVEVLDAATDLLVGVNPQATRRDHEHVLPPGSTLLLYTDGLVERRHQSLADGIDRLTRSLRRHADLPVVELLDAVVADLVGAVHADDIALLAVRLHPEDVPRPPEADA